MASPRYSFWYTGKFSGTLANGATTTISIPFAQNTSFTLMSLRMDLDTDTEALIEPNKAAVKFRDASTGQEFTNDFVKRNLMFSSAKYGDGGLLPQPMVFAGNSTAVFDVRNDSGGNILTIDIVLYGVRENY